MLALPVLPEQLSMDATSHIEISQMLNRKYSNEIVARAFKAFNLGKLNRLKANKLPLYLKEGKRQINELWRCIEALEVHTAMFTVSFLIAIGKILNDIEAALGKKSNKEILQELENLRQQVAEFGIIKRQYEWSDKRLHDEKQRAQTTGSAG